MNAIVERSGREWHVTVLDDGYRRPELTEVYMTEAQADARATEINGDETDDDE